ncbi:hypothetical protein BGZ96_001781 [Linnemannia gamsii]|uniref:Uncharacterized protein n=1 Tax=Linnemannia gamsii TaxID=64522 RepID=A0ABQ7JLQ2_9FUNG|nr:hypothetical protein BGZ96_001781 [Linnemannia gamsii]
MARPERTFRPAELEEDAPPPYAATATESDSTAVPDPDQFADHTATAYSLLPSHVLRAWTDAINHDDGGGDCRAIAIAVSTVPDAFYDW